MTVGSSPWPRTCGQGGVGWGACTAEQQSSTYGKKQQAVNFLCQDVETEWHVRLRGGGPAGRVGNRTAVR